MVSKACFINRGFALMKSLVALIIFQISFFVRLYFVVFFVEIVSIEISFIEEMPSACSSPFQATRTF
jgi:hypothetical protein